MKALTTLFVVGMFLTTVAMADDVDDVRAALNGLFAERLETFDSLEEQRKNQQARVDAGLKSNLQNRHIDVRVYGNLKNSDSTGVPIVLLLS